MTIIMIRLIDGTEWNDDDYYAQVAQRRGWTRSRAKNYCLLSNYSTPVSLSELYGATRAGGKGTMLAEEVMTALSDLPRGKVIGSGRPCMLPQQRKRIVWDEMGLFAKDWYCIDENGVVWNMGIDWAAPESKSYSVVTRITRTAITLEMKDAEDQTPGVQPLWITRRGRHGPRTARARTDSLRASELLLHRWGSDVPQLLRGIREREAADVVETTRVRIHYRGNDRRGFRAPSSA